MFEVYDHIGDYDERIEYARNKQYRLMERFHIGDTVYPFWLHNFIVYGTVIDIDTVAHKIICDFNGVRRQFCPEDLMLVNPVLSRGGARVASAGRRVRFSERSAIRRAAEARKPADDFGVRPYVDDRDDGVPQQGRIELCKHENRLRCYNEKKGKYDYVCVDCGKHLSSSGGRKASRNASSYPMHYNEPDYTHYVYNPDLGKIESGWEFREDAMDHLHELMADGCLKLKVYSARKIKSLGIDAENDGKWMTGGEEIAMISSCRKASVRTADDGELEALADTDWESDLEVLDEVEKEIEEYNASKVEKMNFDKPAYKFYVMLPSCKVESGWKTKIAADRHVDDLRELNMISKTYAREDIPKGIDLSDDDNWYRGRLTLKKDAGRRTDRRLVVARRLLELSRKLKKEGL